MTDCTQERAAVHAENRMMNGFTAASNEAFAQWNNDWKRETERGSGTPRIGVLLLIAAASVFEQRRRRERRQIE